MLKRISYLKISTIHLGLSIIIVLFLISSCTLNKPSSKTSEQASNHIESFSDEIGQYYLESWHGRGAVGGSRQDGPLIWIEARYYYDLGKVRFVTIINEKLRSQNFTQNDIQIVALDVNQGTKALVSLDYIDSTTIKAGSNFASQLLERKFAEAEPSKVLCGVLSFKFKTKNAEMLTLSTCEQRNH